MNEKTLKYKREQSVKATWNAVPPFSEDAELMALGSMVADNQAIETFLQLSGRDDFYREGHKIIFDVIQEIYNDGKYFDILLLKDTLEKRGLLQKSPLSEMGGGSYLVKLMDYAITGANIDGYAKTIHDYALRRRGFEQFPSEKWFDVNQSIDAIYEGLTNVFAKEPKRLPHWAFWTYDLKGVPLIQCHKYLQYLRDCEFASFRKLTELTVVRVEGNPSTMTYQDKRGTIFPSVKDFVTTQLISAGFPDVADSMLLSGKFFSLDILELLPSVDKEIAARSIFTEVETDISFDTPIFDEQNLIVYHNGNGVDSIILSTDNYCSITAETGIGKSLLSELIASEAIAPGCEPHCPVEISVPDGLVLWADGERATADVVRSYKRIYQRTEAWKECNQYLLSEDKRKFRRLEIRAMKGVKDKCQFILEWVESKREKISLILIDGALDLVKNMNDEEQATALTNLLDHLTKKLNCGIIITVHASTSGKDTDGTGMGHVGKGIGRGAASRTLIRQQENPEGKDIKCWTVDFNGGKVRNGPKKGISIFYMWDRDNGDMPHFIDYSPPDKLSKVDQKKIEARNVIEEIFERAGKPLLRHKELFPIYAMAKACSDSSAKRDLTMALEEWGILEKVGSQYCLKRDV